MLLNWWDASPYLKYLFTIWFCVEVSHKTCNIKVLEFFIQLSFYPNMLQTNLQDLIVTFICACTIRIWPTYYLSWVCWSRLILLSTKITFLSGSWITSHWFSSTCISSMCTLSRWPRNSLRSVLLIFRIIILTSWFIWEY